MNKTGPIIIIEDDPDDQELLATVFAELKVPNPIHFFNEGADALAFLHQPGIQPFLVLSDINMPGMDGFELREQVRADQALHNKCIPYLFFTTGASPATVQKAYSLSVQGIFAKPSQYEQWKAIMEHILSYWQDCIAPNRYPLL